MRRGGGQLLPEKYATYIIQPKQLQPDIPSGDVGTRLTQANSNIVVKIMLNLVVKSRQCSGQQNHQNGFIVKRCPNVKVRLKSL